MHLLSRKSCMLDLICRTETELRGASRNRKLQMENYFLHRDIEPKTFRFIVRLSNE